MENIKHQIIECARSREDFAFSVSSYESRSLFLKRVVSFLESRDYREAAYRAPLVYSSMLNIHDKYQILAPAIDTSNIDELFGDFEYKARRKHYCHQANVFLLGLYIYHNLNCLRENLASEMDRTTPVIETLYGPFKFSGGSPYGEFLYRWRIASLVHDMGTGIQLCGNDKKKIEEVLTNLLGAGNKDIGSLFIFQNNNLLAELDKANNNVIFSKYLAFQASNPYPKSVYYDHGIVGSLIFLQLMNRLFSQHTESFSTNTEGTKVFWHKDILSHSIVQTALAIALHNLGNYEQALKETSKKAVIFDMKTNPFAWVLKVADLLQEWDKPTVSSKEEISEIPTIMNISFKNDKILIANFPEDRKEATAKEIKLRLSPNNIIFV